MPAGSEFAVAHLTGEIADGFVPPVVTVADQGMERGVGDLEVKAVGVGAGETMRIE